MSTLKVCPKCNSKLESDDHEVQSNNGVQYCSVCDYWTMNGTARLDSIMIFAWDGDMHKDKNKKCMTCGNKLEKQTLGVDNVHYCRNCDHITSLR